MHGSVRPWRLTPMLLRPATGGGIGVSNQMIESRKTSQERHMTGTKSRVVQCLVVVLLFTMSGCDFSEQDEIQDRMRERVENRRQQWESQGIETYRLIYSQQVGDVLVDTVSVVVTGGTVDSSSISVDVSEAELLVGTVDSFFDLIEARIGEEESQFDVQFNQERGYPTRYTADFRDDRPSQTVLTIGLEDSLGASDPGVQKEAGTE